MIRDISETLADLIASSSPGIGIQVAHVGLESDSNALPNDRLILSLYSIEQHDHMRNRPREFDGERYVRAPIAVRLYYMVTYNGAGVPTNHLEAQTRLDRVAHVFHTYPILGPTLLRPSLVGMVDKLAVRLWSPTSEERNQIWTAFGRPLRLALYYIVDTAPILPEPVDPAPPIIEKELIYQTKGAGQ